MAAPSARLSARVWLQAALAIATAALFVWLAFNAWRNMERQSLPLGLDFLDRPAGFTVLQSLIAFDETSTFGRAFAVGLLNTLLVSIIGIALTTPVGFGLGIARLSPNSALRTASTVFVEVTRNLPLLLILFFIYFAVLRQLPPPKQSYVFAGAYLNIRGLFLPWIEHGSGYAALLPPLLAVLAWWTGFKWAWGVATAVLLADLTLFSTWTYPQVRGLSVSGGARLIPEFVALVAALTLYTAAYIAEIVRAGLEAVARRQREAGLALGLDGWQTTRLVVIPQALRLILPPLTSQYLNLTKNSSLAVAIAYPDLVSVFAGTSLAQTGRAVEIMAMTMGVYLLLSLLTAAILNWQNARLAR